MKGMGAGRRAPLAGRERSTGTFVRLTPQEKQALQVRAAAVDTSVPGLLLEAVRAAAAGDGLVSRREAAQELLKVRRLVANVAGNVNQIAAAANSGRGLDVSRLDGELAYLHRVLEGMQRSVQELLA